MNTPTTPTFHAHGKDWFPHTPGEPMPCNGNTKVDILMRIELNSNYCPEPDDGDVWDWSVISDDAGSEIIGWRDADPQPESVTDELARLREKNANMRAAIRDAQFALAYYSSCIETNVAHDVIGVFTAESALAKLALFTHP